MKIRPAAASDAALLLAWRNDPVTRAMSGETGEVAPERHGEWLAEKLTDPSCELWIGEIHNTPVAQVRLDLLEGDVAVVSISVAPDSRGRGYASEVLTLVLASSQLGASTVRATVRHQNDASRRLFERAGFAAVRQDSAVTLFERAIEPSD